MAPSSPASASSRRSRYILGIVLAVVTGLAAAAELTVAMSSQEIKALAEEGVI